MGKTKNLGKALKKSNAFKYLDIMNYFLTAMEHAGYSNVGEDRFIAPSGQEFIVELVIDYKQELQGFEFVYSDGMSVLIPYDHALIPLILKEYADKV
jgi:hypothetical protein